MKKDIFFMKNRKKNKTKKKTTKLNKTETNKKNQPASIIVWCGCSKRTTQDFQGIGRLFNHESREKLNTTTLHKQ